VNSGVNTWLGKLKPGVNSGVNTWLGKLYWL